MCSSDLIEELLVKEPKLAPHYLIEVAREGPLDEMTILVEMRQDLGGRMSTDERTEVERHVQHVVKSYVGVTAQVRVLDPGKIERSQGKARRVRDLRPKD